MKWLPCDHTPLSPRPTHSSPHHREVAGWRQLPLPYDGYCLQVSVITLLQTVVSKPPNLACLNNHRTKLLVEIFCHEASRRGAVKDEPTLGLSISSSLIHLASGLFDICMLQRGVIAVAPELLGRGMTRGDSETGVSGLWVALSGLLCLTTMLLFSPSHINPYESWLSFRGLQRIDGER